MVQLHASNFSIPQQFVVCSKARQQQCAINSTNIDTFGENDRDKQSLEPSQSKLYGPSGRLAALIGVTRRAWWRKGHGGQSL